VFAGGREKDKRPGGLTKKKWKRKGGLQSGRDPGGDRIALTIPIGPDESISPTALCPKETCASSLRLASRVDIQKLMPNAAGKRAGSSVGLSKNKKDKKEGFLVQQRVKA